MSSPTTSFVDPLSSTLRLKKYFTHVGAFVVWPDVALDSAEDGRIVLFNDATASNCADDEFLEQLLKKSVILQVSARRDVSPDALSVMQTSCHRLRFRSSRKRRSAPSEHPFRPIERVKLAAKRADRADSSAIVSPQLPRLVRSLQERRRIGQQQLSRLELLARDKTQTIRALSSLLSALDGGSNARDTGDAPDDELISLVSVLQLREASPAAANDVATPEARIPRPTKPLELQMAGCEIMAVDAATSTFRCLVKLGLPSTQGSLGIESFALSLLPTDPALAPSRCQLWLVDQSARSHSHSHSHSCVLNVVVDVDLPGWTLRSSVDLSGWVHCSEGGSRSPQYVGTIRVPPPRALWELPAPSASLSSAPAHVDVLIVSAGSSLPAWLHRQPRAIAPVTTLVRPRFAIMRIPSSGLASSVRQRLAQALVNDLPQDVVVVPNPLERAHVKLLRRLLQSLHDEARHMPNEDAGRSSLQTATDLVARELLLSLQRRVQFLADTNS
ncbi:hypothetical protein P43SY_001953 [Pythium insidiosum]|uniref:Uncharacterized protein n=1 Tax=Pythium insidiosum TaxID=114742 RepID=A0AAD5QAB7_PYTIN|nr:hypothetical protein P43SY_001953 [Pythium insidiosum]